MLYPLYSLNDKKTIQEKLSTEMFESTIEKGKALLKLERFDKALEVFYGLSGSSSKAFLGTCLLKIGNDDFARKTFDDLIKSDNENGLFEVLRALLFYNDPKFNILAQEYSKQNTNLSRWVEVVLANDVTLETYKILTELKPDDWRGWCKYGALLYNEKHQLEESLSALDKSIALTTHYLPVYQKAIILNETDRSEEAIAYYQKVIDINDRSNTISLFHLAEACNSFSRYQDSLVYLNKALEMDPDNHYASALRGKLLMQLDKWEEAFPDLLKSYEKNPEDINACYWYGIALHHTKKLQTSLEILEKVLLKDPNHASAWLQKGICLYKIYQEKFESMTYSKSLELINQSVKCYEKCVEVDPGYARGYFMLALVQITLGNKAKAREWCEFGLKVNPKDPSGQAIFAQLESDEKNE
jgi:tetratricopeptide (TPR) repeat protein